ncbi:MAG: FHA domain-containing protein [Lentisphaeria bacterium]|nr:FHA domain-containing protein [Lentisphaeria bacterium]
MGGSPKITLLSEQLRGKTFELTKDVYTVGRIEERDICIADPTISTFHCTFTKEGNTYILRDNNSTNGTRINNVPISEQELQKSDIIQMGDVEMLYYCEEKATQTTTRTLTGINLSDNLSSSSSVTRMEAISPKSLEAVREKNKNIQKIIYCVLGGLGLVIVGLLVWLVMGMFGGGK